MLESFDLKEAVLGVIRHTLTAVGGYLVAKGALDVGTVETVIGAAVTLIGVVWSVYQKKEPA